VNLILKVLGYVLGGIAALIAWLIALVVGVFLAALPWVIVAGVVFWFLNHYGVI
jgi:hypothetical protein